MDPKVIFGTLLVVIAGLCMGSAPWPMKIMKKFRYEHWAFVAMLVGLVIIPWGITLCFCPNALQAYQSVESSVFLKSNLFSLSWGIANVLSFLCLVRIGFSLTGAILAGLGVSIGVIIPMIFKGTGKFENAPGLFSPPGLIVLGGVAVMLIGVTLVSWAGWGRNQALHQQEKTTGSFLVGLLMAVIAGITSCGISLAFVYSQGPIVKAMQDRGAHEIPANFAVWAAGLTAGVLVNILYPAFLMTKNKSWHILNECRKEILLSSLIGFNICLAVTLMGRGMVLLGPLGASVGFGVQQAMQIMGGQGVGFISGEWKGVTGKPRTTMYLAIAFLMAAAVIMAYGNSITDAAAQ